MVIKENPWWCVVTHYRLFLLVLSYMGLEPECWRWLAVECA